LIAYDVEHKYSHKTPYKFRFLVKLTVTRTQYRVVPIAINTNITMN